MPAAIVNLSIERGSTFNPTLTYQLYSREVDDAAMTVSTTGLISSKALFTAGDVGRSVVVQGAGAARANLTTTISSVTDSSTVVLANACSVGVTKTYARFYDPVNLTGYSARMKLKDSQGNQLVSLVSGTDITLGGTAGTIMPVITATVTATLPVGTHFYDLELVNGSIVQKLFKGTFSVLPEVTT